MLWGSSSNKLMAHVYFITRGKDNAIEAWLKHLSTKWFAYQYNGQAGVVEAMLRPIQLWEFGYPAEHRDVVMETLFDGQKELGKHQSNWKGNVGLKMIAKALDCKPIAPWTPKGKFPMPPRDGVSVMGIGEREDKINYHPLTGKPNEGI